MIKSDRWIKRKCTPPRSVVTERIWELAPGRPVTPESLGWRENIRFSHQPVDELEKSLPAHIEDLSPNYEGIVSVRAVRGEDLEHWKPMISPFVSQQVREVERNGTADEMNFLRANGAQALADKVHTTADRLRVDPMLGLQIRQKIVSYGLSSYGYDVRIADEFMIFTNVNTTVVNPKDFDKRNYVEFKGDVCIIPPNSFVLARSLEYFRMPRNVTGLVLGKSTYARCGINCLATPLEAGWEGHITLEYANTTPLPAMLFANEGAAQVLFFEGDEQCEVSYADRGGKYQGQTGITLPTT